jgi:hypothetical protein
LAKVPSLDIAKSVPFNSTGGIETLERFATLEVIDGASSKTDNTPSTYAMLQGPSARLKRIASMSASFGDLLTINRPIDGVNSTHELWFYAPLLQCELASTEVSENMTLAAVQLSGVLGDLVEDGAESTCDSAIVEETGDFGGIDLSELRFQNETLIQYIAGDTNETLCQKTNSLTIGYYAGSGQDLSSQTIFSAYALSLDDITQQNMSLWVAVADHAANNDTEPVFLDCAIWNVSMTVNVTYTDSTQVLQASNVSYLNKVNVTAQYGYPRTKWSTEAEYDDGSMLSYTAYFSAVIDQLDGLVGTLRSAYESDGSTTYINNATIQETVLTGAEEYLSMSKNLSISQTAIRALNITLGEAIDELALNTTLNMLSDDTLR